MATSVAPAQAPLWPLLAGNVLGGVGTAAGIAVGALLVQSLGGTALAGVGQALGVLGAGLAAVPLAALAARGGRRTALTVGYALAALGGAAVIVAAVNGWLPLLLAGLLLFGCAQAANLQTRFAASDLADPSRRAQRMSLVVWATTVGAVAGPNLIEVGAETAHALAIPPLSGPYVFSVGAFVLAGLVIALALRVSGRRAPSGTPGEDERPSTRAVSAPRALAWAARHPVARFAVTLIVISHAAMVGLMSMASIHLAEHRFSLQVIGVVISLHILGMYAFSPVLGWVADRYGAMRLALGGLATLAAAVTLGVVAGWSADLPTTAVALLLLGLGWSAGLIASSALMAGVDAGRVRVPLQGATDALMNYAGAAAAVLSAPVLAAVGYAGLSVACGVLLVPALVVGWVAHRSGDAGVSPVAQR